MTFNEILEEIYLITNRRDLVDLTKATLKAATLKGHKTDFYSKDIFETGVDFLTLAYSHSYDYISLISNFRAFKYLRRVEDAADTEGTFLDIITVDQVLDSYGVGRTDIAYVAGRVLEMRASVEFRYALLGCYVQPIVTEAAYTSWIAEQQPYYIIHESARRIFMAIGQMDESGQQTRLMAEELTELRMSAVVDVGY